MRGVIVEAVRDALARLRRPRHHRVTLTDTAHITDNLATASGTARTGGEARATVSHDDLQRSLRQLDEQRKKADEEERCEREQAIRDLEGLVHRLTAVPWWERIGVGLITLGFVATVIPRELAGLFC